MSRISLPFVLSIVQIIVIVFSQGIDENTRRDNASSNRALNLEPAETRQSDLWLISRNDPVPAILNRYMSQGTIPSGISISNIPNNAYGSRLNSLPRPVLGRISHRSNQNDEITVFDPNFSQASVASRRQNNANDIEEILVELPVDVTSGFWEQPHQELMEFLSARARQVGPLNEQTLSFETSSSPNIEQEGLDRLYAPRDTSTRLPVEIIPLNGNDSFIETFYGFPFETIAEPQDHAEISNNSSLVDVLLHNSRGLVWNPSRSQQSHNSSSQNNNGQPIYEISFDELLPSTSQSDSDGIKLTPDDIEILAKLGILSALNFEPIRPENESESSQTEKSAREYEDIPQLIDNVSQEHTHLTAGKIKMNDSDVVLVQVPNFTTSSYHGNIAADSDSNGKIRPIPYTVTEPVTVPSIEKILYTSLERSNISLQSSYQIQEILQLLGLNQTISSNEYLQETTNTSGSELKKDTSLMIEDPTSVFKTSSNNTLDVKPTSDLDFNNTKSEIENVTSSGKLQISSTKDVSFQIPKDETAQSVKRNEPGLVSSGKIQPRLLEELPADRLKYENEIIEFFSGNVNPLSARKLELLRKLRLEPKPYIFGFAQHDGNGTFQHRNETSNSNGVVEGSYGYRDPLGVYRNVNYVADEKGFHAVVRTNEPGTISHSVGDAVVMAERPPPKVIERIMAYTRKREN